MKEQVRRQQRLFMGYNLVAFALIFTIFGIILYTQIRASLYLPVEESLLGSQKAISDMPEYIEHNLTFQKWENHKDGPPKKPEEKYGFANVPMRIQSIIRDTDGKILNPESLGRLYFEDYLAQIPHPTDSDLDHISIFSIDSDTYYTLSFTKESVDGTPYTVQLISSLDAERAVLNNITRLMVLCLVVMTILSISASYLLSRQTMAPIIKSWRRQTEFVENASHELRTPLTIIQNKLESLLTKPQSTVMENAESVGVSLSEMRRLTKLTADLMTLARADSNETQVEKESFPLDPLITTVCEPYQELAAMQEKDLELDLQFQQNITGDKNRIHELMVILLDNALKYTCPEDHITVCTFTRDGRAVIEVADTGIGIPNENRERIFDRFYREDKARSRETGGSGLGLSIAKWIVDAHEGSITVHGNSGGGTIFRVKLKL